MKEKKQAEPTTEYRRIPDSLLLAFFILICVLGTVQMLAKYVRGTVGGDSARVASFEVTSNLESFEQEIQAELQPGDEGKNATYYTFDFTNSSETAVDMTAQIFSEGNLPLRISYKEGQVSTTATTDDTDAPDDWKLLTENLITQWETNQGTGYLSWTDHLGVNSGVKPYTIKIEWPKSENSYQYKNGTLALKLRIDAAQAD